MVDANETGLLGTDSDIMGGPGKKKHKNALALGFGVVVRYTDKLCVLAKHIHDGRSKCWLPALQMMSVACSIVMAGLYTRRVVRASKTSASAMMRAGKGISAPCLPSAAFAIPALMVRLGNLPCHIQEGQGFINHCGS